MAAHPKQRVAKKYTGLNSCICRHARGILSVKLVAKANSPPKNRKTNLGGESF